MSAERLLRFRDVEELLGAVERLSEDLESCTGLMGDKDAKEIMESVRSARAEAERVRNLPGITLINGAEGRPS